MRMERQQQQSPKKLLPVNKTTSPENLKDPNVKGNALLVDIDMKMREDPRLASDSFG